MAKRKAQNVNASAEAEAAPAGNDKQDEQRFLEARMKARFARMLPMLLMLALRKVDIDDQGYRSVVESLFLLFCASCLVVFVWMYCKISCLAQDGTVVSVPESVCYGWTFYPASQLSTREYDCMKLRELLMQLALSSLILGATYKIWGSGALGVLPLVLQLVTGPLQIFDSSLFKLHVLQRDLHRPFVAESLFEILTSPEKTECSSTNSKKES